MADFLITDNLDDDAVLDGVKEKIRFLNVLDGAGEPVDPPSVPEKVWIYLDTSTEPSEIYGWSPDAEAWFAAGGSGGSFQPLDSDLTAIAALATTAFGRALLTQADAAALRSTAGLGTAATQASSSFDAAGSAAAAQAAAIAASQPLDSDLTAIAALSTTTFGRALLALVDLPALQAVLGTGTPSGTTYLRGDGTWSTPAGSGLDIEVIPVGYHGVQASDAPGGDGAIFFLRSTGAELNGVYDRVGASTTYRSPQPDPGTHLAVLSLTSVQFSGTMYTDAWAVDGVESWFATTLLVRQLLAAYAQPLDSDLTAIAALTTTSYGRALLTTADLAALQAILGTGTPSATTYLRGDGTWDTPAVDPVVALAGQQTNHLTTTF